jgi:hypothetical protein
MRAMRRLLVVLLLAGCAASAGCVAPIGDASVTRAPGYRAAEIRRPAIVVHLDFGSGDFSAHERSTLPDRYVGALAEALNARAIVPLDLSLLTERADQGAALARAREVRADQAILLRVEVARGHRTFCREARPFSARSTVWGARVDVLRVSDGAPRLSASGLEVTDVEPDCATPAASRRLLGDEAIAASVDKVLGMVLRP